MRAVRLDAIQIARLFAALLVVFDHTLANLMGSGAVSQNLPFAFRSGGFGVYIFFLISGFVMAHSTFATFGQAGASQLFLRRRLIRIVPMYWLVTLLIAAKGFATSRLNSLAPVALSLAFIPYLADDGQVQPLNGVGWTLNYEMLFYLIFTIGLIFTPWLGILFVSTAIIALVAFGGALASMPDGQFLKIATTFWTDPIMLYFIAGIWIGLLRIAIEKRNMVIEIPLPIAIAAMLVTITAFEILLYFDNMSWWLEACFAGVLVAAVGMINSAVSGRATAFLKLLGDASYSIYLVHLTVVIAVFKVCVYAGLAQMPIVVIVTGFSAASLAGLAAYKFVEKPMLNYFQGRFRPAPIAAT